MDASAPPDSIRVSLLAWYDRHARDLPWRRTADPYAVWVSEVMLQQTRVDTVVPYYQRWMERWPTLDALAGARQDHVLKAWEGLGYYRRARMLHRAAAEVRDRRGGELPDTAAGLRELPGVGEYTAGAVASIAFGEPVPAVDGNVRRVLSRLFDLPSPGAAELRTRAAELVDPDRPGDFNQALMELGATVCTPAAPACEECPLHAPCAARALGVQAERPAPRRGSRAVPERAWAVAVPVRRDHDGAHHCLMVRRPPDGFLGGLWDFPARRIEEDGPPAVDLARSALNGLAEDAGGAEAVAIPETTQAYSHFMGRYRPFVFALRNGSDAGAEPPPGSGPDPDRDRRWVALDGLGTLAVPVAQRRIAGAALELLRTHSPWREPAP